MYKLHLVGYIKYTLVTYDRVVITNDNFCHTFNCCPLEQSYQIISVTRYTYRYIRFNLMAI